MTDEQTAVLDAALALVNGGLDLEECLHCYAVISKYVIKNPPQELEEATNCKLNKIKQQSKEVADYMKTLFEDEL
jgi:microcompartment protein CcmL/EutN